MVKGQKRTIDPKKVTTLEKWVHYYKSYGNVVKGPENTFLVLDPATLDEDVPVKTFTIGKGVDAISELQISGFRAPEAQQLLETAAQSRAVAVDAVNQAFREKEQVMLREVQQWKTTNEPATKSLLADSIGRLQKELSELDTKRREAKYPHRYILKESRLPRKVLNYATRDERIIQHTVFRTVPQTTLLADRLIEEDKA